MSHHHDLLAILPNVNYGRMGQEYDRDKPPDQIFPQVLVERWHRCQAHRIVPQMGLYVAFVESQIELPGTLGSQTVIEAGRQGVQSLKQSRDHTQVRMLQRQITRSALGQHLPDAFPLFLLALSGLGHILPEVLCIEDQTIEQELR